MSSGADNLTWLMNRFASSVPLVRQAVVVSSDGLAMARSGDTDREAADRLSAVASGSWRTATSGPSLRSTQRAK